jgi:hypothetical protein
MMQTRAPEVLAIEWLGYNVVGFGLQRAIDLGMNNFTPQAVALLNYTDKNWIGLSNLMGINSVNAVRTLWVGATRPVAEWATRSQVLLRVIDDVIAAELAEVIYLAANQHCDRDMDAISDIEKAAVRTVGTAVVRLVEEGVVKGLNKLGFFNKCKKQHTLDDELMREQLLDEQELGAANHGLTTSPVQYGRQ